MVATAMALAALLAIRGLGNQLFWDDEANTAIYGRNLLRFGRLTAWDGTNLVSYSFGGALGDDLGQELRVAPLPSYVAAAGLYLFGGTADDVTTYGPENYRRLTIAGRLPFVVLGVLSLAFVAIWLRRHFGNRFPWWLPPLILALSPAFLLYIRNCRYYALGVTLSVAIWMLWAPGRSRARRASHLLPSKAAWIARCAGAALATVLLIFTHYLNAASLLVTLPLFFFDARYRQRRQLILLGVIYSAAALAGAWILATANPFNADYNSAGAGFGGWTHFSTNAAWFIRDLGTHEFVPWVAVAAFVLPWLPRRLRRQRPLALRAWVLVVLVLVYAVLGGLLTPADMGNGPTAEIRYVVPMIVIGSILGTLAVAILWRWYRLAALGTLTVLVGTNFLHLGFLANRVDGTRPWWPPTLVRYIHESSHDFQTGNEELIGLLAQLPAGTTVRVWPTVMVYPAMFYVPTLHYCDQLELRKKIRPELGPMPDYLYFEKARPDVVFFQPELVYHAMPMHAQTGEYELTGALARVWGFMGKPEIPNHFFSYPKASWHEYPGMAVLVRVDSALAENPLLRTDTNDAEALARWGAILGEADRLKDAIERLRAAVEIDPNCFEARFQLGFWLWCGEEPKEAAEQFRAAVLINPRSAEARVGLGKTYRYFGQTQRALTEFEKALKLEPYWASVHYHLGQVLLDKGATDEAIKKFREALELEPEYPNAHVEYGIALFMQGKPDEAIEHYQMALRMVPQHPNAHANLAAALVEMADQIETDEGGSRPSELRYEAVIHYGEALREVPAKGMFAAKLRQFIEEQLLAALQRVPSDHLVAETAAGILERAAESTDDSPRSYRANRTGKGGQWDSALDSIPK